MRDLPEEFCNMWLFFLCICLNLQYLRITYIPYYKNALFPEWVTNVKQPLPTPHPPKNIIVYFKDQMLNLLELQ